MKRTVEKALISVYKELKDTSMLNKISDRIINNVKHSGPPLISSDGVTFNITRFNAESNLLVRKLEDSRNEDYEIVNLGNDPKKMCNLSLFLEDNDGKVIERKLELYQLRGGIEYSFDTMKYYDEGSVEIARLIDGVYAFNHIPGYNIVEIKAIDDIINLRESIKQSGKIHNVYDQELLIHMMWNKEFFSKGPYGKILYIYQLGMDIPEKDVIEFNEKIPDYAKYSAQSIREHMTRECFEIEPFRKLIRI